MKTWRIEFQVCCHCDRQADPSYWSDWIEIEAKSQVDAINALLRHFLPGSGHRLTLIYSLYEV